MKKKAYLIIENSYPTIHANEKEAKHYVTFVRDTSKAHQRLKAMFCLFTDKDLSEGLANCTFKAI